MPKTMTDVEFYALWNQVYGEGAMARFPFHEGHPGPFLEALNKFFSEGKVLLVEKQDSPTKYLAVHGGLFGYTTDPAVAIQFARQEDAERASTTFDGELKIVEWPFEREPGSDG